MISHQTCEDQGKEIGCFQEGSIKLSFAPVNNIEFAEFFAHGKLCSECLRPFQAFSRDKVDHVPHWHPVARQRPRISEGVLHDRLSRDDATLQQGVQGDLQAVRTLTPEIEYARHDLLAIRLQLLLFLGAQLGKDALVAVQHLAHMCWGLGTVLQKSKNEYPDDAAQGPCFNWRTAPVVLCLCLVLVFDLFLHRKTSPLGFGRIILLLSIQLVLSLSRIGFLTCIVVATQFLVTVIADTSDFSDGLSQDFAHLDVSDFDRTLVLQIFIPICFCSLWLFLLALTLRRRLRDNLLLWVAPLGSRLDRLQCVGVLLLFLLGKLH
mmetsp:Transcript_31857/g.85134  ORF Transcript_31857/g.85134 Transcript_31857/m.85134 type:complete len:321 (+) Transcript_31857:290-1252(+)